MTKIKSKNFIIPLIIYPFDVMVSFGENDSDLEKQLNKYGIDTSDEGWKFENIGVGRFCLFPSGQMLIRLNKIPESCKEYGTLQHEIFHTVHFFMERINTKLLIETCEPYAYLVEYLTTEIYKKII